VNDKDSDRCYWVVLSPEVCEKWLDPDLRQEKMLLSLLKPFGVEWVPALPPSRAVGRVPNQGE
jgi:hypothetical protein